mmetsp:Transcript_59541/g.166274  ORF Transcript_59541/g.166274 Transcript_59541/m.166274 type:complete len:365 (-) Transcript_59541:242-1336(-)
MEVSVLAADGLEPDHVIQIRVGDVRRQAKLSVGKPFTFPTPPTSWSTMNVEAFRSLGRRTLALSPDAEQYVARFSATDHEPWSKLQLGVWDTDSQASLRVASDQVGSEGHRHCCGSEPPAISETRSLGHKLDNGGGAKEYLEDHRVLDYVQHLLARTLAEMPEDPYFFMWALARNRDCRASVEAGCDTDVDALDRGGLPTSEECKRLAAINEELRADVERLRAIVGDESTEAAMETSLTLGEAPDHALAQFAGTPLESMEDLELDLDCVLDQAVCHLYDNFQEKNLGLRASNALLAHGLEDLRREREDMRTQGLVGLVAEPSGKINQNCMSRPPRMNCLETENSELERANIALVQEIRRFRLES